MRQNEIQENYHTRGDVCLCGALIYSVTTVPLCLFLCRSVSFALPVSVSLSADFSFCFCFCFHALIIIGALLKCLLLAPAIQNNTYREIGIFCACCHTFRSINKSVYTRHTISLINFTRITIENEPKNGKAQNNIHTTVSYSLTLDSHYFSFIAFSFCLA